MDTCLPSNTSPTDKITYLFHKLTFGYSSHNDQPSPADLIDRVDRTTDLMSRNQFKVGSSGMT